MNTMNKTTAKGYRINGVFCEPNMPVPCEIIPKFNKFKDKLNDYLYRRSDKIPVPDIDNTSTLYRIKFCDENSFEYLDEDTGLLFEFYNDDNDNLMFVVKEVNSNFFYDYFQFNYYEHDKIPGKRFIKNLLKFTSNNNIGDFVKNVNKQGKKLRNDPNYSGNPDWDGTLEDHYVKRLLEKAG